MSKLNLAKKVHYQILYAFYYLLLTKKQQQYFEWYFFQDWSLEETAQEANVSRNAIFTSLSKTLDLLDQYEAKLHLYEKQEARTKIYQKYHEFPFIKLLAAIDKIK